jgi:hypothetical protein
VPKVLYSANSAGPESLRSVQKKNSAALVVKPVGSGPVRAVMHWLPKNRTPFDDRLMVVVSAPKPL